MIIRLVNGNVQTDYNCEHIQVTTIKKSMGYARLDPVSNTREGEVWEGIEIELCPNAKYIFIPDDGEVVYQMNDAGDTVDTYRWPKDEW